MNTFVPLPDVTHDSLDCVTEEFPENATMCMQAGGGWLAKVTGAWQAGRISNLDYLLYCNLAAGRSFNDLTQVTIAII